MPILVTDPIIRVRTSRGTDTVGLQDVLTWVHDGTLVDLSAMRADQRSTVVTALAILSHVLRRYSPSPLVTSDDWLKALRLHIGDGGLVLAGGPDESPQFLQPVLKGMRDHKAFNITETDHLMPANRHVLKVADRATPELGLYGLMTSTWRHNGGVGNPAGARSRLLTVLTGDGVTIASEIASLSNAYDATKPTVVGTDAPTPKNVLDHMLWALPWQTRQAVTTVAFPFIDCRRIRLIPVSDGLVAAIIVSENGTRVDTGTGDIDDPHVPIQVGKGQPYKLALNRVWSYRVQHAAVAGSSEVSRPRILDLVAAYSHVRICGIGFDNGITKGAWESLYRIGRGKKMKLGGTVGDRLSDLSSRALGVVQEATGLLYGPMLTLYGNTANAKPYLNRAQSQLRDLLGHASLQSILDLVAETPDTEAEQRLLHQMAASGLRIVWNDVSDTLHDPLARARASLQMDYGMKLKLGERLMSDHLPSQLRASVHAALHEMDLHLTPSNRATIRSSANDLPIDAWLALAAAPVSDMDELKTRLVWETVVRALCVVRQGAPSIGRVLAETDYPEARLSALLTSHGGALVGLIAEAVRWLISHDVEKCTLTDIVVLGIADARDDSASREAATARIALDYARAIRRQRSAA